MNDDLILISIICKHVINNQSTYQSWRKTTHKQRAELLRKIAQILRTGKEELAGLITIEMGKLIGESRTFFCF